MSYRVHQTHPYFNHKEIEYLKQTIESGWVTEGPFQERFLRNIKKQTGAKYAVLASNGTLALYLALLALELNPEDEAIVPDFTFNASASSIVFSGGTPVFVDINKDDLQIDASLIEDAITAEITPGRLLTEKDLQKAISGRGGNRARRFAVWVLHRTTYLKHRDIGQTLNMSKYQVARIIERCRKNPQVSGDWTEQWFQTYPQKVSIIKA